MCHSITHSWGAVAEVKAQAWAGAPQPAGPHGCVVVLVILGSYFDPLVQVSKPSPRAGEAEDEAAHCNNSRLLAQEEVPRGSGGPCALHDAHNVTRATLQRECLIPVSATRDAVRLEPSGHDCGMVSISQKSRQLLGSRSDSEGEAPWSPGAMEDALLTGLSQSWKL